MKFPDQSQHGSGLKKPGRSTLESAHRDWHFKRLSAHEQYDFFVSYRRVDEEFVKQVMSGMKARRPDLNIFVDQERLKHGVCWKPELVGSIYNARRALCVVTDTYPDSAECIDEFHVALCCSHHRAGFLRPIIRLHHRTLDSLPATIRKINLIDGHCPPRQISQVIDAVLDA